VTTEFFMVPPSSGRESATGLAAESYDALVLGAGPAGLLCASEAALRGLRVLVVDHERAPGRKLLLTGGGRCNFTNRSITPANYVGAEPAFVAPALRAFGPDAILGLLDAARVPWEEREQGQLFCLRSAADLLGVLLARFRKAKVDFRLGFEAGLPVALQGSGFALELRPAAATARQAPAERVLGRALVVATGGLSYPKVGASPFGYAIARSFGHELLPARPGLVPFTWNPADRARFSALAGVSVPVAIRCEGSPSFRAKLLFTHRGLSGPAALQVSTCWRDGKELYIDLFDGADGLSLLERERRDHPKASLASCLARHLPRRLVDALPLPGPLDRRMAEISAGALGAAADGLRRWTVRPAGTEGYAVAEVTSGGVATAGVDPATMASRSVPGLFFAGEVLDVTGWLGGYNLQWAFSSGVCAGRAVQAAIARPQSGRGRGP
jgi:predicted Rossmann fold flavoprotein